MVIRVDGIHICWVSCSQLLTCIRKLPAALVSQQQHKVQASALERITWCSQCQTQGSAHGEHGRLHALPRRLCAQATVHLTPHDGHATLAAPPPPQPPGALASCGSSASSDNAYRACTMHDLFVVRF